MMNTIALDDEPLALELLETYCRHFDFLTFEKGFTKTTEAAKYLERHPVDLLFLDIHMPAMSGLDFYKALPQKPPLILTTSFSDYALESYELNAIDYLLKPFTLERFEKAVHKANGQYQLIHHATVKDNAKFLTVKADYGVIRINHADILFVEALDNYLKIHLHQQPPAIVRMTLKALEERLHPKEFLRVHRSYIIPVHRIEAFKNKTLTLAGTEIPVGKNYEELLKNVLKNNI